MLYFRTSGVRGVGKIHREKNTWIFKTKRETSKIHKVSKALRTENGLIVMGDQIVSFSLCTDLVTDGNEDDFNTSWKSFPAEDCTYFCDTQNKVVIVHGSKLLFVENNSVDVHDISKLWFVCVERMGMRTQTADFIWYVGSNKMFSQLMDKKQYHRVRDICSKNKISIFTPNGDPLEWKKICRHAATHGWSKADWEAALCDDEEPCDDDSDYSPSEDGEEEESEDESLDEEESEEEASDYITSEEEDD